MPDRPITPRVALALVTLATLLAVLTVHRLQCAGPVGPYVPLSGRTMGTTYEVKIARADLSPDEIREIGAAVEDTLARVNSLMSTWREDSEISRFNAHPSTEAFPIDRESVPVYAAALEVGARSGGALDVTVAPLVDAWGFGPGSTGMPPSDERIAELRSIVGLEKLELDRERSTLTKRLPELRVDLSAVAKGYGVDAVSETLEALGCFAYLVEVGGELRARGERLDGRPFRVAIEEPTTDERRIHRVIELHDLGMATSGDYRNWIEVDGVRLSHTLDPRTGRPITHALASVSVLHPSAMWADAWATALDVLGPEAGYDLAVAEGLPAYFIVRTAGDGFEVRATPAIAPYLESGDGETGSASN